MKTDFKSKTELVLNYFPCGKNSPAHCDNFQKFLFSCLPWANPANWCLSWEKGLCKIPAHQGWSYRHTFIITHFLHLHSSVINDDGHKSLQPQAENVKTASQVSFIVSKKYLCPYKGIHPLLSAILHLKQKERKDPLQHICSPTT